MLGVASKLTDHTVLAQPSVNLCIEFGHDSFSLTLLFPRKFTQEGSNLFSSVPKAPNSLWIWPKSCVFLLFTPAPVWTVKLLVYSAFIAYYYFCDSITTKILEEDVGIFCPFFWQISVTWFAYLFPCYCLHSLQLCPGKMENSQRQEKTYSLVLTFRSWGCITQFGCLVGSSLWHFCFPLPLTPIPVLCFIITPQFYWKDC